MKKKWFNNENNDFVNKPKNSEFKNFDGSFTVQHCSKSSLYSFLLIANMTTNFHWSFENHSKNS